MAEEKSNTQETDAEVQGRALMENRTPPGASQEDFNALGKQLALDTLGTIFNEVDMIAQLLLNNGDDYSKVRTHLEGVVTDREQKKTRGDYMLAYLPKEYTYAGPQLFDRLDNLQKAGFTYRQLSDVMDLVQRGQGKKFLEQEAPKPKLPNLLNQRGDVLEPDTSEYEAELKLRKKLGFPTE